MRKPAAVLAAIGLLLAMVVVVDPLVDVKRRLASLWKDLLSCMTMRVLGHSEEVLHDHHPCIACQCPLDQTRVTEKQDVLA